MNGSSIRMTVAAGMAAMVLVSGYARAGQAGEESKRIAVVNVSRVFKAYKKVTDIQTRLEALFEQRKKAIIKKEDDLQKDIQVMKMDPEDPQKNRAKLIKMQQLEIAKFDLDKEKYEFAIEVEKKRLEEMKQVLKEIRAAISDTGKAEKIDMVLRAPEYDMEGNPEADATKPEEKDEAQTSSELVRRFRENPVLYFSQGVDITSKVITKLNDDYAKSGGGAVAPAPAPAPAGK
ncbi:MAG: OmpH family outer membrane protein [Planctomycetes bacterium]|nr:OmpH family outer membrane protein [Planctomycetota bacterium]